MTGKFRFLPAQSSAGLPNLWDIVALICITGLFIGIVHIARSVSGPIDAPRNIIHLSPSYLPEYALRTTFRMFAALFFSLIFTFVIATLAAKSKRAAMVIIPTLDVLQSVPILGFLTFTVAFFLNLFPGMLFGAELAAIFAIFTSQAWNMAFSFYQSLITIPEDLKEVADSLKLSPWQRYWRLEVPYAIPGLVWNTMLSMSGGWFFVVAAEAVTIGNTTITLPGIGSYVAKAILDRDTAGIWWAVLTMFLVILLYDQLIFRPIVAWSDKFRTEYTTSGNRPDPWVLKLLHRTFWLRSLIELMTSSVKKMTSCRLHFFKPVAVQETRSSKLIDIIWAVFFSFLAGFILWRIADFMRPSVLPSDLWQAVEFGFFTLIRVLASVVIACIIWVPVGVWIGLRPKYAGIVQPIAQFLAAFPANLLFPVVVFLILYLKLNPNIWLTVLMLLGTQWYILFNVIAGASAFPNDLLESAKNFRVRRLLWWRRVILPFIFPYLVTGAVTASGGAWNASIVAEVASWGHTELIAKGLGSYITLASVAGNWPHVVLGVVIMSLFVLILNRLIWHPLYNYAMRIGKFS